MTKPPTSDLETVAVISDQAPVKAGDTVVATVEKGRMFGVLARRGDEVEVQVCVGAEIHRGTLQVSHVKFLTEADIDLASEWLKMSKDLNPKTDLAAYGAKLDALVERVADAAAEGGTPREKARLIGVQLFEREGFSFADVSSAERVLDLKQGNCFSLSFIYLCIGKRLGVPFYLVTAPEHAFVRYDDSGERFNMETTDRGRIHASDDYLREHLAEHRFGHAGGIHLASLYIPRAVGVLLARWGVALGQVGRYSDGCAKFAKAAEITPRLGEAYNNWGTALGDMGKPAEACEKYAKAVEINPRHAGAYYNWGTTLATMGKHAEACERYAKAIEIDTRDAGTYNNWGNSLGKMGKHGEACEKHAKAVEINTRYAEAYSNWGWALGKMGKTAEAIEKLDKAAALDPAMKAQVNDLRKKLLEGK